MVRQSRDMALHYEVKFGLILFCIYLNKATIDISYFAVLAKMEFFTCWVFPFIVKPILDWFFLTYFLCLSKNKDNNKSLFIKKVYYKYFLFRWTNFYVLIKSFGWNNLYNGYGCFLYKAQIDCLLLNMIYKFLRRL